MHPILMVVGGSTFIDINWAALAPLLVLLLAFVVYCWIDIARHPVKTLPKWAWALICVASVPLGGIIYLIVGHDSGRSE